MDYYNAGMQALQLDEYKQAEKAFSSARSLLGRRVSRNFLGREYAMVMAGLADAQGLQGKRRKAKACYKEALHADPLNIKILLRYGTFLQDMGDPTAEAVLLQAYHLKPADTVIAEKLMGYYASEERWLDVVATYEQYRQALDPITGWIENGAYSEGFAYNNDGTVQQIMVLWNHPIVTRSFQVNMVDGGAEIKGSTLLLPYRESCERNKRTEIRLTMERVCKGDEAAYPARCVVELNTDNISDIVTQIKLTIQTVRPCTADMESILRTACRALDKDHYLSTLLQKDSFASLQL